MHAIVYRCSREGRLLDRAAIQAAPVRGELRVSRKGMKRVAVLLKDDGESYALPVLDKIKLLAINDHGVLLSGLECFPARGVKGSGPVYAQTWWFVLRGGLAVTEGSPAEARAPQRQRGAEQIGASFNTHYSKRQ